MKLKLLTILAVSTLFIGCGDKSTNETKVEEQTKTEVAISKSKDALNAITQVVKEKVTEAKEVITEKTPEITKAIAIKTDEVKQIVSKQVEDVTKMVNDSMKSADTLYKPCAGCHGVNSEKKALGKSEVIKGWSEDKILTALIGYKNGTYGGSMKAVMTGQVKNLSNDDLKILSKHISEL